MLSRTKQHTTSANYAKSIFDFLDRLLAKAVPRKRHDENNVPVADWTDLSLLKDKIIRMSFMMISWLVLIQTLFSMDLVEI